MPRAIFCITCGRICSSSKSGFCREHSPIIGKYYRTEDNIKKMRNIDRKYMQTEEYRKRHREAVLKTFENGRITWNKGKSAKEYLTKEALENIRKAHFIDGRTPLYQKIRHSVEIKQWRKAVFKRNDYICQECGVRNGNGKEVYLEAHHIKPFSKIIKENNIKTYEESIKCKCLWDIDNGITLCKKCHNLKNKEQMKGNKNGIYR